MIQLRSVIFVSSFALALSVAAEAGQFRRLAPDFFVDSSVDQAQFVKKAKKWAWDSHLQGSESQGNKYDEGCREKIASLMCLVDPPTNPDDPASSESRPCLAGSETYAHYLEEVYDHLTPTFQRMFCSLKAIYIENKLGATAYANVTSKGIAIGIRRSLLDQTLPFAQWATWKEQLAFGGHWDSYEPTPGLPHFVSDEVPGVNNFLYQVIVHEFGHQFDFANGVNALEPRCAAEKPDDEQVECPFLPGTWGALSWATNEKPLPENDFKFRDGFCFYGCNGSVTPLSQVTQMYEGLYASSFINAYAATQAWDDFADGMAYYAMDSYLSKPVYLDTAQGERFDFTMKLHSERYRKKYEYIENFLKRTDIRYP